MVKTKKKRILNGLIKEKPDRRDLRAAKKFVCLMSAVKADYGVVATDWRQWMNPPRDQGPDGACSGFAGVAAMEALSNKRDNKIHWSFSEEMLYNFSREYDEIPGADHEGSTLRGIVKVLNKFGVCETKFCPYDVKRKVQPSPGFLENAKTHRVSSYLNVERNSGINAYDVARELIHAPVIGGFFISEKFSDIGSNGIVTSSTIGDKNYGHAMCIAGFDVKTQRFIIRNSWGSGWADHGYCYMPINLMQQCLISAWSVRL